MLNIFYILNKYSSFREETIKFFLGVILPVVTRFQKGILFSSRMINEILLSSSLSNPDL